MTQDAVEKTAFYTPFGHFEFRKIPFGISNAPATFQRLMNCCFPHRLYNYKLMHLDGIIIFSESADEHLDKLALVVNRMRKAGFKCKDTKCLLSRHSIVYLGHTIDQEGVAPKTATEIRS